MRSLLPAAVVLAMLPACALPYKVEVTPTGAPRYKHVRIVYTIEAGDSSAQLATQLTIEYPHPDGTPDVAHATLQTQPGGAATEESSLRSRWVAWWSAEETGSILAETDFPKHQLDLLLSDLAHTGFFEEQTPPWPSAGLSVEIDRGRTAKPWIREPRLDDFLARTQTANNQNRVVTARPGEAF